ncbi:bacillithiol biosynthesis cysteine-adding enzyme BshC [Luteibaculum oceani]|uniref:Putative cysteine ligase BshC n=1 Tax=Luteibaculum oceani TaxID=1294296 RepID=A0A5C6VAW6_9FLAO|nr:bacillithiol biosynthesis cysteine-adding enzyme BshC [Luteibaculum oceani]TXC81984.1 bacillithiol biosynthesis cysteine-adding enzyme BshC [Luteibaculum oceani]
MPHPYPKEEVKANYTVFGLPFQQTGMFGNMVRLYQEQSDVLKPFIKHFPSVQNFKALAENRQEQFKHRKELVSVLEASYKGIETTAQKVNIEALSNDRTVTVTTGHQLCFLGGPMYFVYKAIHTIKLAEKLSADLARKVVPVFWLASEDHDFDEVAQITLFGKKKALKKEDNLVPVGRFNLQEFKQLKDFALSFFQGFDSEKEINEMITSCWEGSENLSQFTFKLLNRWFGDQGLLVLEPDNKVLKKLFRDTLRKEVKHSFSQDAVEHTLKRFPEHFKIQAPPKSCNLFYIKDGKRYRLDKITDDSFNLYKTDYSYSLREMEDEIEDHPERFSPNVILRPLYQETILPNIAYIGGGGELAYWVQLADLFEMANIPFPQVMLRNSFQLVDSGVAKKIEKLGLSPKDLFLEENLLIDQLLAEGENTDVLDFRELTEVKSSLFQLLKAKVEQVDPTLGNSVEAQEKGFEKALDSIQKKLKKRLKERQETEINQVKNIKSRLFPDGGLQERSENVLHYLAKHGNEFFDIIKEESGDIKSEFNLIYLP